MDGSKNNHEAWQVDDILKELGMLDDRLPSASSASNLDVSRSSAPKPERSPTEEPSRARQPGEADFSPREESLENPFFDDDGETKVWTIPSAANFLKPSQEALPASPSGQRDSKTDGATPKLPVSAQTEAPEEEAEEEKPTLKREIFEWAKAILFSFAAVFLVFGFLIRVVTVDGSSMEPTLQSDDRLVISKLFYTPKQGDVVVLSEESGLNKPLIKRVIATEGQKLDISEDGSVLINGLPIDEPYIEEKIAPNTRGQHNYPVTVPENHVFVMGDNRNNSTDSRYEMLSFVDEKYIMGRVLIRIYPLDRIGTVKR